MTKLEAIKTAPAYYQKYIELAEDNSIMNQLEGGGIDLYVDAMEELEALGDYTYAEGKWTVKEIVQHLIDTERVFAYRVLCFGRKDQTNLAGFDENLYAQNVDANRRKLSELLEEYQIVRLSNTYLFKHFSEEELAQTGIANNNAISIGAIGYIMIGHAVHHFNVIQERYTTQNK